ncbi:DUF58 domain-containing protein [Roseovarius autotrophicus]|uniref:DUF58 domain-containing protein n=1 Tax=Roseovarius autotrophicus TaxID=2824121 RepID=UPI0019F0E625|nr:DUF58 domain-containing protein [Roseovarius autotrophicus]MBE0452374.1 DUF58 domain-containing protein [Roseovarius sp.]
MSAPLDPPGVALRAEALIALRHEALAARRVPVAAALPGGVATRARGQGLEMSGTRAYVPGDDIRRIDRGTSARTGRLHLREFSAERDRVALLVADFRPSMFWGVGRAFLSVAAAEVLALVGWRLIEEGGRAGLLALSAAGAEVVRPRGRARGMLEVIGAMVRAHAAGLAAARGGAVDPPLDTALEQAARLVPAGAEIVLVSGFETPGDALADRLGGLGRRRALRLILVTEALAGRLPAGRYPIRPMGGAPVTLHLGGPGEAAPLPERAEIAGHSALVLDAAEPPALVARRLAAEAHQP